MASRDLHNNIGVTHLLDAQDTAGVTTASNILDTQGFESAEIIVNVGAATPLSGSNYLTPVLQESDTIADTSFTTVAAAGLLGAFTAVNGASDDNSSQSVGYIGNKRYIRVNLVVTGTLTATNVAVVGVVGNGFHRPVSAPAAITAT